jgi:hypothetical protein
LILGDGTVDSVKDDGSDLPDPEVIACMQDVFARICFNRPEAGVVTESSPLQLEDSITPVRSPAAATLRRTAEHLRPLLDGVQELQKP